MGPEHLGHGRTVEEDIMMLAGVLVERKAVGVLRFPESVYDVDFDGGCGTWV